MGCLIGKGVLISNEHDLSMLPSATFQVITGSEIAMKGLLVMASLTCVFVFDLGFAHGGRLNAQGCHNDNKNGGYHCHRSGGTSSSSSKSASPSRSSSGSSSSGYRPQVNSLVDTVNVSNSSATKSSNDVVAAQVYLDLMGYYFGEFHGIMDATTTAAVKGYQKDMRLTQTGQVTRSLLGQMKQSLSVNNR